MTGRIFNVVFLLLSGLLWLVATARSRRTPSSDPDRPAREDVARLMAAITIGVAGALVRSFYSPHTTPFLAISLLLVPPAIAAMFFAIRIFSAFRDPEAVPADRAETLPDITELRSRIGRSSGPSSAHPGVVGEGEPNGAAGDLPESRANGRAQSPVGPN